MKRRGVTLLELLVAAIVGLLVALATGYAYQSALTSQARLIGKSEEISRQAALEARLRDLLRSAALPSNPDSPSAFFIYNNLTGSSSGGTRLVFASTGEAIRPDAFTSEEALEDQNAQYGPQAGLVEVELGTEVLGSGSNATGLLLRTQRPADGDPTQGGEQEVLFEEFDTVEFEFYDGASWVLEWDTQTMQTPRIPAAVRMRYRLTDDDQDRVLTVRLPASDITLANPLAVEGTE